MFNKLLSLPTLPDTLVSLNVCYNQLTQLPEQLPPNLESLLCIWNQLEKLPDSFTNLSSFFTLRYKQFDLFAGETARPIV